MKKIILVPLLFISFISKSQNEIEWTGIYKLTLSDFQSPSTKIGHSTLYSLNSMCGFSFYFHMSNAEFLFTKNFNSKVTCSFSRTASALVAPDTATALLLLNFEQFDFDLAELYARKFRQKLFENKKAFSDVSFVKPAFDSVQTEYAARHTAAAKDTDMGRDSLKLLILQREVSDEINRLPDFCRTCKPNKKKS